MKTSTYKRVQALTGISISTLCRYVRKAKQVIRVYIDMPVSRET
ncbi:MAG: hypothetical protein J5846_04525 [Desulfovibrio sp.]|nr:hypothetical protein [Desulfovibrio sp.]